MSIRRVKFIIGLLVSCVLLLVASHESGAAEGGSGVYLLGLRGPFAGIVPAPGVYFQNDFFVYRGQAGASEALPFDSQIVVDATAKVRVDIPTVIWSTPIQFLGGNIAFSGTLPFGGPIVDVGATLSSPLLSSVVARNLHDSIFTYGDPVLGALIGWHAGNFHWAAGVSFFIPAGDYRAGALANISRNRPAQDIHVALTWFDPKVGLDLSAFMGVTFNGTNPATDYRTGNEFHLDVAALQNLPNGVSFGLVGYYYQQFTGDSGSGAQLGELKGRVAGLGGALGYTFKIDDVPVTTRLKLFREFAVENRLENGIAGFFTVSLPLYVSSAPPAPARAIVRTPSRGE